MSSLLETRQFNPSNQLPRPCSPLIAPFVSNLSDARSRALAVLELSGVDRTTYGHSLRVEEASVLLAEELIPDEDERAAASTFAITHDVGKLCVRDLVNLRRRFNDQELKRMQRHPEVGAKFILSAGLDCLESHDYALGSPFAERVTLFAAAVARGHHSPVIYGDKGYPSVDINAIKDSWLKEHIGPLLDDSIVEQHCIVVAAADNFDAFAHKRVYSKDRLMHEIGRSSVNGLDEILTMIEGNFKGLLPEVRMKVMTALEKVGGMIFDRRSVEAEHVLSAADGSWFTPPFDHKFTAGFPRYLRASRDEESPLQKSPFRSDPAARLRLLNALGTI